MHTFYKIITTIGIVATLGSIVFIGREIPAAAQSDHPMRMEVPHKNMGSRGTPPGEFRSLTSDERQALQFYNQGIEKLAENNYKGAIAAFTQVLKLTPDYDMAYYNRGNAHRELGAYQAAIADYSKALETNPTFTYLLYNRGNLRESLGDIKGAIEDYTAAIESYPEEGRGYSDRGAARYKLGDIQAAMEDLNAAIRINPGYAGGYANRANVYAKLGKRQAAIADYQKAQALYQEQGIIGKYLKITLAMKEIQQLTNSTVSTK